MFKLFHNHISDSQLQQLADNLSVDDKREIEAIGWKCPAEAIRLSVQSSTDFSYIEAPDDSPAGIAGVVEDSDFSAVVWLLTTDAVHQAPIAFVKQSKYWLDNLKSQYNLLHNIADARNTNHLKLLKLLGFKRLGFVPTGPERRTFVEFAKLL